MVRLSYHERGGASVRAGANGYRTVTSEPMVSPRHSGL